MSAAKNIKGKIIVILVADGVNDYLLNLTKHELEAQGAVTRFVALKCGSITTSKNANIEVDYAIDTVTAYTFDALYIPGGIKNIQALLAEKDVLNFVCSMYTAGKHIAIDDEAISILEAACLNRKLSSLSHQELRANGVFFHKEAIPIVKHFVKAIAADHPLPVYQKETPVKDVVHVLSTKH